jgi:hypothetical protein
LGAGPFGSRGSLGASGQEENHIEIFPAITHFADAITALPKELVRHFTLLKEVDAKIFAPEEDLARLVEHALNAPPPQRPPPTDPQHILGPTSAPMSAQNSLNGSVLNGHNGSVASVPDAGDVFNLANSAYDPANLPRRQIFQHCAYTMQNMLVSLDEKNHVISTAAEALNKQLARIDDVFPYVEQEVSEEARNGSLTHWAYPENRVPKTGNVSRREIASANNIAAAAQHIAADEAAARSDARKQALLAKKGKAQHVDSDFDEHHDKNKEKKLHGNTKARKAADASPAISLGITNGAATNGNPRKRQKVENKGPGGGAVMERSISAVLGNNGNATKAKVASPRETPVPETKKRVRNTATTNGQNKKRYALHPDQPSALTYSICRNTNTNVAMSPSLASSPIRNTFPEPVPTKKASPPPTNGARPAASRARQNSTQSIQEKRPPSAASNKQNGNAVGTPDITATAAVTGKSIPEVKTIMKEMASNSKGEQIFEDAEKEEPEVIGAVVVGSRKDSTAKREESETNGDVMQGIQTTTVTTTKSGRASKPSTPAIPSFPEPVRSRSSRAALETASNNNKRSHKKGAGAAAQLLAQQTTEADDSASNVQDDEEDLEVDADEPRYCYCNGISYGEMVGCDADNCEREWFHLDCVGLKVAPKSSGTLPLLFPCLISS